MNGVKYIHNPREPIDEKLIENIRTRFAATHEGDSLHSLIHDKNGPFKTPKDVEKLFPKTEQEELKRLQKQLSDTEKKTSQSAKSDGGKGGKGRELKGSPSWRLHDTRRTCATRLPACYN